MDDDADQSEGGSAESNPSIFFMRVSFIKLRTQSRVVEDGDNVGEGEAVLALVEEVFMIIPLEEHTEASWKIGIS